MYCVEQDALDASGTRRATMKFWTPVRERAEEEVAKGTGRRLRVVTGDDIPEAVRANAEG